VGSSASSVDRALVDFGDLPLPRDAVVLEADLNLEVADRGTLVPIRVGAYPVTTAWGTGATWTSTGTGSWVSAGGDYDTTAGVFNDDVHDWGVKHWYPTAVVQDWVHANWAGAERPNSRAASSRSPNPTIPSSSILTLRVRSNFGTGLLRVLTRRSEPRAYQATITRMSFDRLATEYSYDPWTTPPL